MQGVVGLEYLSFLAFPLLRSNATILRLPFELYIIAVVESKRIGAGTARQHGPLVLCQLALVSDAQRSIPV